ncbi:MAG: tyrosine--tRNA ligase [Deltaproteobacteria bacterium]|nr:tyrosine--tRNA ligase [Deltaproteobacteria bacterium]
MSLYDVLEQRGFIEAATHEDELRELFEKEKVTGYIGFDPTAISFHVGSLVPIMALAHMEREGHRPIALVGGGTGLVGDPSGKTEMRKILTRETVEQNALGLKAQLAHFIDFSGGAIMANNADWLCNLNYIEFLRDYGRHFSVNRMIKAESYRMRLESEEGLSFIEFNYMCLQAYDFLHLYKHPDYQCKLQMGGSDQWGNIVAGVELVRRECGGRAYGLTFPLITTSSGAKMGKTAQGAVWLDPARTSPYDYYQFWINTHDDDVARFLALFTFLPMEEVNEVKNFSGADLNSAKAVLAFEATALAHGKAEANAAFEAAGRMFGKRVVSDGLLPSSGIPRGEAVSDGSDVPATFVDCKAFGDDSVSVVDLAVAAGIFPSKGEARRKIAQGGLYIVGERVDSPDTRVDLGSLSGNGLLVRTGKKKYHRIVKAG